MEESNEMDPESGPSHVPVCVVTPSVRQSPSTTNDGPSNQQQYPSNHQQSSPLQCDKCGLYYVSHSVLLKHLEECYTAASSQPQFKEPPLFNEPDILVEPLQGHETTEQIKSEPVHWQTRGDDNCQPLCSEPSTPVPVAMLVSEHSPPVPVAMSVSEHSPPVPVAMSVSEHSPPVPVAMLVSEQSNPVPVAMLVNMHGLQQHHELLQQQLQQQQSSTIFQRQLQFDYQQFKQMKQQQQQQCPSPPDYEPVVTSRDTLMTNLSRRITSSPPPLHYLNQQPQSTPKIEPPMSSPTPEVEPPYLEPSNSEPLNTTSPKPSTPIVTPPNVGTFNLEPCSGGPLNVTSSLPSTPNVHSPPNVETLHLVPSSSSEPPNVTSPPKELASNCDPKSWKCSVCTDKGYNRKGDLKRHFDTKTHKDNLYSAMLDIAERQTDGSVAPTSVIAGAAANIVTSLEHISYQQLESSIRADRRRVKCPVCPDRWFTSKGHLNRHYDTTLHKNKGHIVTKRARVTDGSVATTQGIASAAESSNQDRSLQTQGGDQLQLTPDVTSMVVTAMVDTSTAVDQSDNRLQRTEEVLPSPPQGQTVSQSDKRHLSASPLPGGPSEPPTTPHQTETQYKCVECDKVFAKACYLTQHNKSVHSGPKPFKCLICGKRFSHELQYQQHSSKHAAEKLFKCEICPKQFNHKTDLKRHLCLHSGDKPFACAYCGKRFIRKDHTLKHVETHKRKLSKSIESQNADDKLQNTVN